MSLVNEALKKARTQAVVEQAASSPIANIPVPMPYESKEKSRLPILISIWFGCAFVGLLSAGTFYLVKSRERVASSVPKDEAAPLVAQTVAVQPRASAPNPTTKLATPPNPTVAARTETPPSVIAPPPAETIASPSPATRSENVTPEAVTSQVTTLVEGKVYLQSIDLAGVPKIKLDGILWSDKNPAALINGITVAPGDELSEATVVTIEPKRVKLRAQGKEFFLRLP